MPLLEEGIKKDKRTGKTTCEVRRELTTEVIVVRGEEQGKQKNAGDSIMEQKAV